MTFLEPVKFSLPPVDVPLLKAGISYTETRPTEGAGSFADTLDKAVQDLKKIHTLADEKMNDYAAGGKTDVTEVMLTLEKLQMKTDLAIQVRNKLVEGYQEIIRMQI